MNSKSLSQQLNGWIPSLAMLLAMAAVVMQTYPMMYPGYDIWWHLDVIDAVEYFRGNSYGRWHWIWRKTFDTVGIKNFFERALVIHQTQFLITSFLLYASSQILLRAVFYSSPLRRWQRAVLSLLAVFIWLSMHGTSSSTAYGGAESAVTLSWIGWYSVNHQISLPIYCFAASLWIYVCALPSEERKNKWILYLLSLLLAVLIYLIHVGELPYYLFVLFVSLLLFGGKKQVTALLAGCLAAIIILPGIVTKMTSRVPAFVTYLSEGDVNSLWAYILQQGEILTDGGLNRAPTGWNALYTISIVSMVTALLFGNATTQKKGSERKVMILILLTALMPALLFTKITAGLLASITDWSVAWRFSFASLLFVSVPILLGKVLLIAESQNERLGPKRSGMLLATAAVAFLLDWQGAWVNMRSIWLSQDPELVYFKLKPKAEQSLSQLSESLKAEDSSSPPPCLDIFSTYYLYYLYGVQNICLPLAIHHSAISGYSSLKKNLSAWESCPFEPNFKEYEKRKVESPAWEFKFNR